MMRYFLTVFIVLSVVARPADAQQKTITPDLKAIADGKGAKIPDNVSLKWVEGAKGKPALKIQPTTKDFSVKEDWVILLTGIEFMDGVIEFDALGKSDPPQSNFLGFAFRVVDEKTYDAVYFRPFNFRADDAERKAHAVQYISHPKYRWFDLRKDKPGQFEKPIVPAPDGDAWFHARIVIERPKVSVYVNDAKEPSLVVEELSDRKGGGIGLWVGRQGGHFANLKITRPSRGGFGRTKAPPQHGGAVPLRQQGGDGVPAMAACRPRGTAVTLEHRQKVGDRLSVS